MGLVTMDKGTLMARTSRIMYLIMYLITTITAGAFRISAPAYFDKSDVISTNLNCPQGDARTTCLARAFVMRMTWAHCLFHLILTILCIKADNFSNPRLQFHLSFWPVKILVWAGLHVASLFISTYFFLGFTWFALICSVFFLIVQSVMFIDGIFEYNESWIAKDGTDNVTGPYHVLITVISFLFFGLAVGLTVVNFIYFGERTDGQGKGGCELFNFFSSFNLVAWVLLMLFSFRATSWMPATGLLPSTAVAAFMTFKVLLSLFGQNKCNSVAQAINAIDGINGLNLGASQVSSFQGPPEVVVVVAIIIAILMSAYNSFYISGSMKAAQVQDSKGNGGVGAGGQAFGTTFQAVVMRVDKGVDAQGISSELALGPAPEGHVVVSAERFGQPPGGGAANSPSGGGGPGGGPWVYKPPEPQREGSGASLPVGGGVFVPPMQAGGASEGKLPLREESYGVPPPVLNSIQFGGGSEEEVHGQVGYSTALFHFSMMLGMCYVSMQMTNWNEEFERASAQGGPASMWIKIADSWLLAAIFFWSMLAPKVLSGRSFE